jgi:hypothetical protein
MGSRRKDVTEAEEAELLSRATSQAMIAARSILMSGGSTATALSTAKAAAQSILVPDTSDMDGPALGKVFLSKRKAKRQADVVASMALLSVKQQIVSQQGGIPNYPYDGNNSFLQGSVASMQPPPPVHAVGRGTGMLQQGEFANNASYDNTSYAPANNYMERNHDRVQRFQPQKQQSGKSTRLFQQPKSPQELKEQLQQQSMESPQSRKLPGNLPKARAKSPTKPRDYAKGVPEEDPIYSTKNHREQEKYMGVADDSSSSASESETCGSGTIGSDTAADNTVVPHVDTLARSGGVGGGGDGFMSSVDPLLSTLTNVFFCGGQSPDPYEKTNSFRRSSSRGIGSNQESRQDDEGSSSYSEGDDDGRASPASHRRARGRSPRAHASSRHRYADSQASPRGTASHSTADSEQLLKELNLSSTDDEERNGDRRRKGASGVLARSTIRESMEQVVLRALSGTLTTPTPPPPPPPRAYAQQTTTAENPAAAKAKESDAMSATSSLSTANRSRMAVMAQRVKFRKWMRRRRGLKTPQDE